MVNCALVNTVIPFPALSWVRLDLLSIFPQILAHAGYNVHGVSVTEIAGGGDSLFACCEGGGSLCRPMVGVHALR